MSARITLSLVIALTLMLQVGSAAGWLGKCATCGMPEASCACPECGCADPCCDVSCGCPEPACGCQDACCDPCCGVPGCGSRVTGARLLGTCPLLQGLRNLLCGRGCGCGCCGGSCYSGECCSNEVYYGDWHANQSQCETCNQYGNYTGAQHAMPMARRPYVAKRVQGDQIRFAERVQNTLK